MPPQWLYVSSFLLSVVFILQRLVPTLDQNLKFASSIYSSTAFAESVRRTRRDPTRLLTTEPTRTTTTKHKKAAEIGRVMKIEKLPCDSCNDCRIASSSIGPNMSVRTNGASGISILLNSQPIRPKIIITNTSNVELLTAYEPIIMKAKITAVRMGYGIAKTLVQSPTNGTLRNSSSALPTKMLAMTVQTSKGCSVKSLGPGASPFCKNAPVRTASDAVDGIPRKNKGTNAELTCALLAVSGAVTPSIAPRPNSALYGETRFWNAYARTVETVLDIPGTSPVPVPINPPVAIAGADRLRSVRLGIRSRSLGAVARAGEV